MNAKENLAIVIATYKRPDGRTPEYLHKTLSSIDKQTYRKYKIFLIGDAYPGAEEVESIVDKHLNVVFVNNSHSPERERYGMGNMQIWSNGGVTAVNTGIDLALKEGYEYICHMAHDDLWDPNHLELLAEIIEKHEPIFACTLSTYGTRILPEFESSHQIIPFYPIDGGIIASATCVNYKKTTIRPVDRLATEGILSPCDAYLWERLRNEMKEKDIRGYLYTTLSCHHDEEGYAIRAKQETVDKKVVPPYLKKLDRINKTNPRTYKRSRYK